ncbi:MAG: hypothetical protein AAGG68_07575 [Bacteroidota bacterium]
MRILLFFGIAFLLVSCAKETATKIEVDPEFQPFVDSFIAEAAKRGIEIDFEETGLSLTFGEVPANANGVCTGLRENISSTHEIIIDRNRWKGDNEFEKERLIYHELGHCHLLRGHISDTLANGEFASIMRGVPPNGFGYRSFNMTGVRRTYYIDELFNKTVEKPDWASLTANYDDISEDQKELLFEVENKVELFRSTDLSGDFEVEMEFVYTNDFLNNALGFYWSGFGDKSMGFIFSGSNLFIVNRLEGYGVLRAYESFNGFRLNQPCKLTVRRIDDKYFYFANEQFLYWSQVEPLKSNAVELYQNGTFQYEVPRLSVKRLI